MPDNNDVAGVTDDPDSPCRIEENRLLRPHYGDAGSAPFSVLAL
jgi:hypothetical protein